MISDDVKAMDEIIAGAGTSIVYGLELFSVGMSQLFKLRQPGVDRFKATRFQGAAAP